MKTLDLEQLHLKRGPHKNPEDGMCVMEAISYFAGEPFSDEPKCVCPMIGVFLVVWNDNLDDDNRQQLKRFIPMVIGTQSTVEVSIQRAWMALDWLVRVHTPTCLRLAELHKHAQQLVELPALALESGWSATTHILQDAFNNLYLERPRDIQNIWEAERKALEWDLAVTRSGQPARSAASFFDWTPEWTFVLNFTRRLTSGAARNAGWNSARGSNRDDLAPELLALQQSTAELLERMIALGKEELP